MSPAPRPSANEGEWNLIPLKACTEEDLRNTRHHIMRFQTKQDVDILKNFTRPVRLHRKDPRNIQFQLTRQEIDRRRREGAYAPRGEGSSSSNNNNGVDQATGEGGLPGTDQAAPENPDDPSMALVAPDGGARKPRRNMFKRKTRQVHKMDENKRKLRYEEYYPWVMEDYDGQNVFVGNYEAGLSEFTHVLFVFDKDGFKMVPAEKVYKFTPRNRYATLTLEEAEAKMEKNQSAPRWLMKHMDDGDAARNDPRFRRAHGAAGAQGGGRSSAASPVNPSAMSLSGSTSRYRMRTVQGGSAMNEQDSDQDELDFDEEFADDEEAPIMDGAEEDNKLSERKMKKEMLKAAHLGGGNNDPGASDDDDLDDLFEVEKSRKVDKEGKKLKKVLNRTEGGVYDSDDNEELNPYVSQSDLESQEDSDDDVPVKQEPTDDAVAHDQVDAGFPRSRSIFVSSNSNYYITIKAPKQFLLGFQPGEWNPNVKKRPIVAADTEGPSSKKIKSEDSSELPSASALPVPQAATPSVNLDSAGPSGELVTTQEVLEIVRHSPLTTKELLQKLKHRISTHKDNKVRIITIVKQNLKLVNGQLRLKDQ